MKTYDAIKSVKKIFPEHEILFEKKFMNIHSEVFLMNVHSENEFKVVAKFRKSSVNCITTEYENLSRFYNKYRTAPRPLGLDIQNNIIIMEYVEGLTLKKLLLKKVDYDFLVSMIEQSAIALSKFHQLEKDDYNNLHIDSPLLCDIDISKLNEYIDKCGLGVKIKSFLDYSPWNNIVNNSEIFLIDFPDRLCVCTPHIDIARFNFCLKIIKQYPQFKFLKKKWWEENLVSDIFFKKYCEKMKSIPNQYDLYLINYFEISYAKKLCKIYNNDFKLIFEKIYLNNFLKSIIN